MELPSLERFRSCLDDVVLGTLLEQGSDQVDPEVPATPALLEVPQS